MLNASLLQLHVYKIVIILQSMLNTNENMENIDYDNDIGILHLMHTQLKSYDISNCSNTPTQH